ncbi:MAG: methyl-accepting chemotaxis protein [Pseudorhodoplanes sp.]|jgi:methyl-accepting chemotaxis protein|nr:methyl-accepting chemotaxis protein [Pseudorhodoplanes sp.]
MPEERTLSQRLEFMKLDASAREATKSLKPLIEKELPQALDSFYARVKQFPETSRFFRDDAHIQTAKSAQLKHWSKISAGEFSDEYAQSVRTIGQTHARIGLDARWYIGGYALITEQLIRAAIDNYWPKGAFGGKSKKAGEAAQAIGALVKSVFLDMDLAISAYLDSAEMARRELENTRNIAIQNKTEAITALSRAVSELAEGNLLVRLTGEFSEEYQELQRDFNSMASQLEDVIRAIAATTAELANAASEISASTVDLSQRTEEQAASLEQTSASMEEISVTVKNNAENATRANDLTRATREVADRGGKVVSEAVSAMTRIEDSSRKISDIISVIDEIARQTNLLALNAAVEAARAGEAGRGFAVVASEVRSLAQRSSQAAKDIKDLITSSAGQVKEGVDLVNRAGASLSEIVESIKGVATIVSDIANASNEQASGIDQVTRALTQMDEVTQQNSALVEENAATAKTLEEQQAAMSERIAFFRLEPAQSSAVRPASVKSASPERAVAAAGKPTAKRGVVVAKRPAPRPAVLRRDRPAPRTIGANALVDDQDWQEF